ncbi:MAG TPA: nucleotidyltransferase substrate binding protein [Flavobacteriaceae bacterium]|nr:nucleotidyltransferase substrate binding protein [Flavobacteriaceae bacterium]
MKTANDGKNEEELERLDLDREGIVQRFEYCFELFLLTLKDYLENTGELPHEFGGKRGILKSALQHNLIQNCDNWRKMLIARNLTSHLRRGNCR